MRLDGSQKQDLCITHNPLLFAQQKEDMASTARRRGLSLLLVASSIFLVACSNVDSNDSFSSGDYEIIRKATSAPSTPTPEPVTKEHQPTTERQPQILTDVGEYSIDDFEALTNFKLSKSYDVEDLERAESTIYGFFGPDPYDRQEYEARFYPDHDTAITVGVDFANEATGPDAVLASATQRWDEGLTQRRACAANTRGSHHSGRCNIAKYGDYVVAGNLVLLCQGRDSETALKNCEALYAALQN